MLVAILKLKIGYIIYVFYSTREQFFIYNYEFYDKKIIILTRRNEWISESFKIQNIRWKRVQKCYSARYEGTGRYSYLDFTK